MRGKHLAAAIMICATLMGCADTAVVTPVATVHTQDLCGTHDGGGFNFGGGDLPWQAAVVLLVVIAGILLVDYADCKTQQAKNPAPTGDVQDGVYRSGDKVFSVALPRQADATTDVLQVIGPRRDVVFFRPSQTQDIYTAVVTPAGPGVEPMTLDEFVKRSLDSDTLTHGGPTLSRTAFNLVRREDISLDGRPAVFELYMHDLSSTDRYERDLFHDTQRVYYLSYFTLAGATGGALYIAWPYGCPKCADGNEADIRDTDPRIRQFVESFQLRDTAATP